MKTVHGTLRKKIENNEPLYNLVTNENIGEVVTLAKLNGYDNFKIFEQLDRKSCKASLDSRLFAILNTQEMANAFLDKYLTYNNDVRPGYLVKTFLHVYYRSNGMGGVLGMLSHKCDLSLIYKYIIEDEFLADELIALAETVDTTNTTIVFPVLAKLIELHESSK